MVKNKKENKEKTDVNVLPWWFQAPLYLDWKRWIHFLSQKGHPVHRKGLLQISLCRDSENSTFLDHPAETDSRYASLQRMKTKITETEKLPVNGMDGRRGSTWQTSTGVVIANRFNDAGDHGAHHTDHSCGCYSWNAPLNCKSKKRASKILKVNARFTKYLFQMVYFDDNSL